MKMSRIALAMLAVAPFVAANAGVTVTPLMAGYNWYPEDTQDKMRDTLQAQHQTGTNGNGVALQSDLVVGVGLGVELTPWLQSELEYQQTKPDAGANEKAEQFDAKHETMSLNFLATSDLFTGNYDSKIKPYALVGGGHSRITVDTHGFDAKSYDTIGNVGGGILWQANDALTFRTEVRGTYNFDEEWWTGQALGALQVVLGGHLKPAAPEVIVEPVQPVQPPVVVEPEKEEPKEIVEDLKMELRVFFDINKSDIKAQYQPEIAKVAEKLVEYPNATARIEGHTDNTGPRKLNERLSLARANSVKSALVNQYGIDANRLSTQGFAWDQPIADNKTKEGRAMNRRVFATIAGSRTVLVQPGQAAQ